MKILLLSFIFLLSMSCDSVFQGKQSKRKFGSGGAESRENTTGQDIDITNPDSSGTGDGADTLGDDGSSGDETGSTDSGSDGGSSGDTTSGTSGGTSTGTSSGTTSGGSSSGTTGGTSTGTTGGTGSETSSSSGTTTGGTSGTSTGGSSSGGTTDGGPSDEDCKSNPAGTNKEYKKFPVGIDLPWEHDGGRSGREHGGPSGATIRDMVNEKCSAKLTTAYPHSAYMSSDKKTRDAICQLYGFSRSTNKFYSFEFSSPRNNHIAFYTGSEFTEQYDARTYNNGHLLGLIHCFGRVMKECKGYVLNEDNIICQGK